MDITNVQVEAFKNYCKFKGITTLLNKMTKNEDDDDDVFKHELVKMYWKNPSNVTDCGIYCMRHMETFKGIGPNWDSGFNRTAADVSTVDVCYVHIMILFVSFLILLSIK